jgi:hypothetical protein
VDIKHHPDIKFSNQYQVAEEGDWIFIHRTASHKVLGLYRIQSCFI